MVSKESLGKITAKAVRIIPGISSYQDKEKLRDLDKRLRNHIASTLNKERERIDDLKSLLTKELKFDPLDDLDKVSRKCFQLADAIKYAAYGYSPLFDQASVDKKKLEELYKLDQSLEEKLSGVIATVDKLVAAPDKELTALIKDAELSLDKLEDRLRTREEFLKEVK